MRHDPTARACTRLRLAHSSVSPLSWLGPTLLVASLALYSATATGAPGKTQAKAPVDVMQVWQRHYDQAQQAYRAGDWPQAEQSARSALEQARAGPGQNQSFVASSLNLLALIRQKQGNDGEAADLLRQALSSSQSGQGLEANTAALALNLGRALESSGPPSQAIDAYRQALDTAARVPANANDNADAEVTAVRRQALQALGRLYADQGQPSEAARYNQRLLQSAPGELPPALRADALEQQAQLEQSQGQFDAARRSLQEALRQRESRQPVDDAALLRTLSSLASVLGQAGLYDEAAPLHRRAVTLLEAQGERDSALASHLNELGLWHLQRKAYTQAEALMAQALAIVEEKNALSLETARIVANLAQMNEARQNTEPAVALFRKALGIYESHGDVPEALLGQAQALNFMAGQDYRRRRFAQAEQQFLRALALTERADGPQSPRLLPLLDNLVALYRSQQREVQAAPYAIKAEQIRQLEPKAVY